LPAAVNPAFAQRPSLASFYSDALSVLLIEMRTPSSSVHPPVPTESASALYNRYLLPDLQRVRLQVVLVSPRNPLNIGAAARAMANFGFDRLAVVAPFAPRWREARSAVGAPELLRNAQETASLAEAVAACTLVVGAASLTRRKPPQPVVPLPALAPLLWSHIAQGGHAALVFGSEKRGLTRGDLSLCHLLVEIPTHARQPSMNLGQAVAVCLYELSARFAAPAASPPAAEPAPAPDQPRLASAADLERLAGLVEKVTAAAKGAPAVMPAEERRNLALLLRRLALTEPDARRILGLFRHVLWRLEHPSGRKPR
jgi:TrmH family RNA methyltransferase